MRIEEFVWNGFDPDVTYSAGIVPIILSTIPRILLIQEVAQKEIQEQKDGTGGYRAQAWWKIPFGKRNTEDEDLGGIASRECVEETGCFFPKTRLVSVVHKRARSKREGTETWHEDYFFLAVSEKDLVPVRGITDTKVCGAGYFPLNGLPITGREPGAHGVRIAPKHLWGIYSLCMDYKILEKHVVRYSNHVT